MAQPYDVPGKAKHDSKKWEWVDLDDDGKDNTVGGYWKLKVVGNPKSYNCSEYSVAKVAGRPPIYGTDDDAITDTPEVEKKLRADGFGDASDECKCPGGDNLCVVLYFEKDDVKKKDRNPFHVAVYDTKLGDWGGKLSAGGHTVRYKDPGDYPFDKDSKKKAVRVVLCKKSTVGTTKGDDWLHDHAKEQNKKKKTPAPPPGGGSKPWYKRWFSWFFGVLLVVVGVIIGILVGSGDSGTEPTVAAPVTTGAPATTTAPTTTAAPTTTTTAAPTTTTAAAPTTTVAPTTTAAPTTTVAPTTTTVPPPPTAALLADGLGVVEFGTEAEETMAVLTELLGPPLVDEGWEESLVCIGMVRFPQWDGLFIILTDGDTGYAEEGTRHFAFWGAFDESSIAAPGGLVPVESTLQDLEAVVGDVEPVFDDFLSIYNIDVTSGELAGLRFEVESEDPGAPIVGISAGNRAICGE